MRNAVATSAALLASLAVLGAAAGCGSAHSQSQPAAVPAGLTAQRLLAEANQATLRARAVHFQLKIPGDRGIDMLVVRGVGAKGIPATKRRDCVMHVVRLGERLYIRGCDHAYRSFFPHASSNELRRAHDRWLTSPIPALGPTLGDVAKETRASFVLNRPAEPAALSIERGKTLNGRKVLVIRDTPHLRSLFVAATRIPYPLLLRGYGRYAGYSTRYDRWNRPAKIDRPPDALPMSGLGKSR